MTLRALLAVCVFNSLNCMGEQTFLSQPDNQPSEISELANSDISNIEENPLLSQPLDEAVELLEIPDDEIFNSEDKPMLIGVGNEMGTWRDPEIPPKVPLYDKKSITPYTVYDGRNGDWHLKRYSAGHRAGCGVKLDWQPSQDEFKFFSIRYGDDWATLGFDLITCGWNNWKDQETFSGGRYNTAGTEKKELMCDEGSYIHGFTLQINEYVGANYDDTSVNGVNIMCSDKQGHNLHERWFKGWWGTWQYIDDYNPLMKVVAATLKIDERTDDKEGLTGLRIDLARFP